MSSDPSHPVVVLSRGSEEPETLIGVLPQQALVAPGKPGQITLEQGGCYFCPRSPLDAPVRLGGGVGEQPDQEGDDGEGQQVQQQPDQCQA